VYKVSLSRDSVVGIATGYGLEERALAGGEWSASCPGLFTPKESAPGTHCIGGGVDPRAGLDEMEERKFLTLQGLEFRPLGRPARTLPLYRLRYPGSG
jgi:hypothetical protein